MTVHSRQSPIILEITKIIFDTSKILIFFVIAQEKYLDLLLQNVKLHVIFTCIKYTCKSHVKLLKHVYSKMPL